MREKYQRDKYFLSRAKLSTGRIILYRFWKTIYLYYNKTLGVGQDHCEGPDVETIKSLMLIFCWLQGHRQDLCG